ncbi:hypothetical protein BC833DRAFT_581355 [Globomyces pollinis-pini]|nr:hypothetical protein BC833DRAFT_581355 [Globomyces pollinis-pini]
MDSSNSQSVIVRMEELRKNVQESIKKLTTLKYQLKYKAELKLANKTCFPSNESRKLYLIELLSRVQHTFLLEMNHNIEDINGSGTTLTTRYDHISMDQNIILDSESLNSLLSLDSSHSLMSVTLSSLGLEESDYVKQVLADFHEGAREIELLLMRYQTV